MIVYVVTAWVEKTGDDYIAVFAEDAHRDALDKYERFADRKGVYASIVRRTVRASAHTVQRDVRPDGDHAGGDHRDSGGHRGARAGRRKARR